MLTHLILGTAPGGIPEPVVSWDQAQAARLQSPHTPLTSASCLLPRLGQITAPTCPEGPSLSSQNHGQQLRHPAPAQGGWVALALRAALGGPGRPLAGPSAFPLQVWPGQLVPGAPQAATEGKRKTETEGPERRRGGSCFHPASSLDTPLCPGSSKWRDRAERCPAFNDHFRSYAAACPGRGSIRS